MSKHTIAAEFLARLRACRDDLELTAKVLHDIYLDQVDVQLDAYGERLVFRDRSALLASLQGSWCLEDHGFPWNRVGEEVTLDAWIKQSMSAIPDAEVVDSFKAILGSIASKYPGIMERYAFWFDDTVDGSGVGEVNS